MRVYMSIGYALQASRSLFHSVGITPPHVWISPPTPHDDIIGGVRSRCPAWELHQGSGGVGDYAVCGQPTGAGARRSPASATLSPAASLDRADGARPQPDDNDNGGARPENRTTVRRGKGGYE